MMLEIAEFPILEKAQVDFTNIGIWFLLLCAIAQNGPFRM